MKKKRFAETQIVKMLKEAEAGAKVADLCRRHGISDATFYTWRKQYGNLQVSEVKRLKIGGKKVLLRCSVNFRTRVADVE